IASTRHRWLRPGQQKVPKSQHLFASRALCWCWPYLRGESDFIQKPIQTRTMNNNQHSKGLDGRQRDEDGRIREKRGDTFVRTLREDLATTSPKVTVPIRSWKQCDEIPAKASALWPGRNSTRCGRVAGGNSSINIAI